MLQDHVYATPEELWPQVLVALRLQMTALTFDAWLLGSQVVRRACTSGFWVIAVRNEYACDWLTHRLYPVIWRTTVAVAERQITLCFIPQFHARLPVSAYPPMSITGDDACWEVSYWLFSALNCGRETP